MNASAALPARAGLFLDEPMNLRSATLCISRVVACAAHACEPVSSMSRGNISMLRPEQLRRTLDWPSPGAPLLPPPSMRRRQRQRQRSIGRFDLDSACAAGQTLWSLVFALSCNFILLVLYEIIDVMDGG